MQTLFTSIVNSLASAPSSDAVLSTGISHSALAVEGQDFSTVPQSESDPSLEWLVEQPAVQDGIRQASQMANQATDFVTRRFSNAARTMRNVMNEGASSTQLPASDDNEVAVPSAPKNHPFSCLPWEDVENRFAPMPILSRASPAEVRGAIKFILCQTVRDTELFDIPPPPDYEFEFDVWRKRFANAMLVIDSELARLRFNLVPKRFREEDFWLMYFYKVETGTLQRLPAKLECAVDEIRRREQAGKISSEQRNEQASKRIELFKAQQGPPSADNLFIPMMNLGQQILSGFHPASTKESAETPTVTSSDQITNDQTAPTAVNDDELEEFEKMLAQEI